MSAIPDTAFVLGNGPSLRGVNLERFSGRVTIGMNAAYRHWERIGWYPTHYCCLDDELIATHHAAIISLVRDRVVTSAFVTAKLLDFHPEVAVDERFLFLDSVQQYWYDERGRALGLPRIHHPAFESSSPTKLTTGAYAVRYAMFLGHRRIYLVGIDCNYVPVVDGARSAGGIALEMTRTPVTNPNYFFDDYQQAGDRYNVPNPNVHGENLHLQSLAVVRDDVVEPNLSVEIRNCSRASQLAAEGIFPYEALDRALDERRLGAVAVPMTFREESALIANLRLWGERRFLPRYPGADDGYPVPLVLVLSGSPDAGFEERIRNDFATRLSLRSSFSSIQFEYCRLTADEDRYETDYSRPPGPHGYKSGPNAQFFGGIKLLRDYGHYVFLMETDCLPIRPNWLNELERILDTAEPVWILGSLYRGIGPLDDLRRLHINGNAAYAVGDPDFQAFVDEVWEPALRALLEEDPTFAYDCVLSAHFASLQIPPGSERWKLYQDVAHRFRYTDFIQNHAGRAELDRGEGYTLKAIRKMSPLTYVVHGRHLLAQAVEERASQPKPEDDASVSEDYPRLLVIDSTRSGGLSATGQLKARLLRDWRDDAFLQIHTPNHEQCTLARSITDLSADIVVLEEALYDEVAAFDPNVIYYRPTSDLHPRLHTVATEILARHPVPIVTHIMDDWPLRLERKDPQRGREVNRELRGILSRSVKALSISERMSEVFAARYGVPFEPVANGVDPDLCRAALEAVAAEREQREHVLLRYCGALAKDMTFQTLVDVARAVDTLFDELPLRFEVYTMPMWRGPFEEAVAGLRGITVSESVPDDDYPRLLAGADVVVLGYNFDEDAIGYIGLSMPNKLPEYLGSGAAVLAIGPAEAAGIEYLRSRDLACCLTERDHDELAAALRRLATEAGYRKALATRAQEWAFEHLDIGPISSRFQAILREAASSAAPAPLLGPYSRDRKAHLDETRAMALLAKVKDAEAILIDVGAHHGSSLRPFAEAGWRVVACEPDPSNRAVLIEKFGHSPNVMIDARAVSAEPTSHAPFFASDQSTGISALHAFTEGHRQTETVDVTTIAQLVDSYSLSRIDFLKIDVEGFELRVLEGVPWDRIRPPVIECEFEDDKTRLLGYTYRDLAEFLVEKGYSVYLSEWHPVLRYGIRHDWRQLARYPGALGSSQAWGNILAFADDPGDEAITSAFESELRIDVLPGGAANRKSAARPSEARPVVDSQPHGSTVKQGATDPPSPSPEAVVPVFGQPEGMIVLSPGASLYDRVYVWAKTRNPIIFVAGQFVMWWARKIRAYPLWAGAFLAVLTGLVALGFLPAAHSVRAAAWVTVSVLAIGALTVGVVGYTRFLIKHAHHEWEQRYLLLRRRLEQAEQRSRRAAEHETELREAQAQHEATSSELRARMRQLEQRLASEVERLREGVSRDRVDFRERLDRAEEALRSVDAHEAQLRELHAERERLEVPIEELRSGHTALTAALADLQSERTVLLDIVSTLRKLRPLWEGTSSSDLHVDEQEHGHALLIALLVQEAVVHRGVLTDRTLLEVGTTRERDPRQSSTEKLAVFTSLMDMRFISVDMDPAITERAREIVGNLNPDAQVVTAKGEDYLVAATEAIDYVYLDAFDFEHGQHSPERRARYREILQTDISDEESWQVHLVCAAALVNVLSEDGIVVIDDTWTDEQGEFAGKGKLAVPLLLSSGFVVVARTPKAVALRRRAVSTQAHET